MAPITDPSQLRSDNPFRPPDWRWQLVDWSLDRDPTLRETFLNDDSLNLADRFRREQKRGATREALQEEFPQEAEVVAWRYQVAPLSEHALQARLLAGASDDQIAQRMDLEPGFVNRYESWFFNVRDRLTPGDWLHITLLPGGLRVASSTRDVWFWGALHGGLVVADHLIDLAQHLPPEAEGLAGYLETEEIPSDVRRALLAQVIPTSQPALIPLLSQKAPLSEQQWEELQRHVIAVSETPGPF